MFLGVWTFKKGLKKMEVGALKQWLAISDHLPLICEFET
jgi:endonuclease/exonuclease/phosphatase (EEP) superfamily protein YafD